MALRMLLVGVVACLGLNQPRLHATSSESAAPTAGVAVLGMLVHTGPVQGSVPRAPDVVEAEGPPLVRSVACAPLLLDWTGVLKAHEELRATLARRRALADALERARTEPHIFSCLPGSSDRISSGRIAEVETLAPAPMPPAAPVDPDAPFLAALDQLVLAFEADRHAAAAWSELPPAPEADLATTSIATTQGTDQAEPEPLYPGLAYALNQDHDGIDDPVRVRPLPTESPRSGESRRDRLATAVRLTGEAIQAWTRIFVQTGPVRR